MVEGGVVVHLVEAVAEEIGVLVGEMNKLQTTLDICLKLVGTRENLISSMDMAVDESADELYL